MSGSTKTTQQATQNQTATNTLDPEYKSLLMGNYATAQGNAASLVPYTGQITAGFTPTQIQAQQGVTNIANDSSYGATANKAVGAISNVVNNPVNPNVYTQANLAQYESPFTSDVINTTIADQERARQIANVANDRQGAAQGAFGGSRSGVIDAATNEGYDRNTASLLANLNQANFTQAQGAAQNTFNNTMTANNAQVANAGSLLAANNTALGTATTQAGLLSSVGDAQQQQQQQALTDAYNAYLQGQQLTIEQQQMLNQALGLMPNQQTTTSSGSSSGSGTQSQTPGLSGILGGLGSIAQGAAMFA